MSYFVKILNEKMQSSQADFIPDKYIVTYQKHEWVFPKLKSSKLFVLGEINDPFTIEIYHEVWLCEAKNPQIIDYSWGFSVDCLSEMNMRAFWHNYQKHPNFRRGRNYICDSVKLIKKLTIDNWQDYDYYGANQRN